MGSKTRQWKIDHFSRYHENLRFNASTQEAATTNDAHGDPKMCSEEQQRPAININGKIHFAN